MTHPAWLRLLGYLDDWAVVREVARGRIEVTVDHRVLTIVMTPDELDEMVGMIFGEVEHALPDVRRWILSAQPDDRFLVYENYELHPSPTEETPGERWQAEVEAKLAELRRDHPDGALGWWYAERRDGTRARFPEPP